MKRSKCDLTRLDSRVFHFFTIFEIEKLGSAYDGILAPDSKYINFYSIMTSFQCGTARLKLR